MSQITETICDQCGERKGKTNHWWMIVDNVDHVQSFKDRVLQLIPGDNKLVNEHQDLCSEQCVIRALSQFMSPKVERSEEDEMVQELDSMLQEIPNDEPF